VESLILFVHVAYRKGFEINVAALNIFCIITYTRINNSVKTNFNVSKLAWNENRFLDIPGCVHHRIIHKENPTKCNSVSKFYFIFIQSLTCFGRHTAHHQELKTALAASGFAYVEGCWTCSFWTLTACSVVTQ
jgi:hypothetical protein